MKKHQAAPIPTTITESPSISARQLSDRWGGSPTVGTLAVWRHLKKGPPWFHVGGQTSQVRYMLDGVIAYEKEQRAKALKP